MEKKIINNKNSYDVKSIQSDRILRDFSKSFDENISIQAIEWLTDRTNRSINQTKFLYEILGDWNLLLELEYAIKTFHCCYCPGDLAESLYLIGRLRVHKACGWIPNKSEYTLL